MGASDPCKHCEELLQPYLDRELTKEEQREAEAHLAGCPVCSKAYRFEERLRRYVRECCSEQAPPELREKLAAISRETRL